LEFTFNGKLDDPDVILSTLTRINEKYRNPAVHAYELVGDILPYETDIARIVVLSDRALNPPH
jgi:hypothetical protein